jgi:hypothetical protein
MSEERMTDKTREPSAELADELRDCADDGDNGKRVNEIVYVSDLWLRRAQKAMREAAIRLSSPVEGDRGVIIQSLLAEVNNKILYWFGADKTEELRAEVMALRTSAPAVVTVTDAMCERFLQSHLGPIGRKRLERLSDEGKAEWRERARTWLTAAITGKD